MTPVDRLQPAAFGAVIALDLTDDPVGGVLTDVDRDVLDSTLDIGWATQKLDGLLVCRIAEVGYPQVRRWARSALPTMWKMTTAQIHHRRVAYSSIQVLGEKPDGTLWNLSNRHIRRGVARLPASDQEKTNLMLAHGLALSADHRAFVRAHLRGATQTTWGGIRAVVRPSVSDLRKAAEAVTA